MVKGTTRQVVIVKGSAPKLFEEAIFLVRDDVLSKGGVSEEALLQEARQACQQKQAVLSLRQKLLWACSGAGSVAALWLLTFLL